MTHRLPRLPAVLLVLAVTAALLGSGPARAAAHADESVGGDGKLLLVLDSSGSMAEPDGSGSTKIEAARTALDQVVDDLPTDARVGMRVYGQSNLSKGDAGACTDTKLVVPVGTDRADALHQAISRYSPAGETPIAYSLTKAAADLGDRGQRSIVLVSDGEETCNPDPCAVARRIAGQGIDLRIDVVGFRVGGKARNQLRCIADAGHGSYYDAGSGDDLAASLDRLSTRAFRPFEISGTPVQGRPDRVGAPEIGIGQYATQVGGEGDTRYYVVRKTPGTSLRVSLSLRPRRDERSDEVQVHGETPGGDPCVSSGGAGDIGNFNSRHEIDSGAVLFDTRAEPLDKPCVRGDKVLISLDRTRGGSDTVDVEMVVTEEPAVRDVSGLPRGVGSFESKDLESGFRTGQTPTKVVGGAAFPDATTIEDGVYSDGILAGEALFYRVRLDFGQHLETRVRVPRVGPALARGLTTPNGPEIDVIDYAPDRSGLPEGSGTASFVSGGEDTTFGVDTPPVRYLNRKGDYDVAGASTAGYYYVAVSLARDDGIAGDIVPFQLDVRVVGEPSGRPSYEQVGSTESPSASASASRSASPSSAGSGSKRAAPDDGSSLVPVSATVGGGLAVFVLLGALGWFLLRRRRP